MADNKSFQCPNCGSPVTTTGAEKEVKCAYCGSTVIVPEELREPSSQIAFNFGQSNQTNDEIIQTIGAVGNVTAGVTAGVTVMSFVLPVVLTCIILGAVGGILYAVFSSINSSNGASNLSSMPFIATATTAPTLAPTPINTPTPFNKVLFKDNFTNPSSGWTRSRNSKYMLEYKNGNYHILINELGSGQTTWITNKYNDVSVEVDTQETAGPNDGLMGVSCRNTDDGRIYSFEYSQDGSYGIYKYSADGNAETLDEGTLSPNTINSGEKNHLEGVCIGDVLTLLLNGQALLQVEDSDYISGGTGMVVRSGPSGDTGLDTLFSNYVVKGP